MGLTQADIWVRHQRQLGKTCYFISGDDAHGTPVMIKAEQEGLQPEEYVEQILCQHRATVKKFNILLDNYYTTHSPENLALAQQIYLRLQAAGDIESHTIEQAYDPQVEMFLPDRYVTGDCPKCNAAHQYGDNCEHCGATYSPTDLKNPRSTLTGATPELKTTEHYFFQLKHYQKMLCEYINSGHVQAEVAHKLQEWLNNDLIAWDITRDKPYFGINIPGHDDKYFYVWLDAPVGYMASFKQFCARAEIDFDSFWQIDSPHQLYHFIGKDIIYFHALFWPAMLHGADFRTPSGIFTHGFMTINGTKMSKSKGTFITGDQFAAVIPIDCFRYYIASKSNGHLDDIDFNFNEFMTKINADLVGKIVNIASRLAKFINKHFADELSCEILSPELLETIECAKAEIVFAYDERNYAKAIRVIMGLADSVNQFIDQNKPWQLIKQDSQIKEVHNICSLGLECFRRLILYLKPILPELASAVEEFLNIEPLQWKDSNRSIFGGTIQTFKPLLNRIQESDIDKLR